MECSRCGTTGRGAFCAQCGAPLGPTTDKDPSDAWWAEDEDTQATRSPSTSVWHTPASQGSPPPSDPPPAYGRGYPAQPPPDKRSTWPLAVGAAVLVGLLVLGVGGGALWLLTSDDDDAVATTTESSSSVTSTEAASTSSDPTTTTITSTTTTSPSSTTASAEQQLSDLRDDSLARLTTDDRWAVSLSAKQDGTRDDRQVTSSGSHVFRLPDILELHEGYASVYSSSASVYLIKAEDLGSSKGPDADRIWMTVVDPGGLYSRDDAAQWCQDEFPWLSGDDLNNACYPRQLESP